MTPDSALTSTHFQELFKSAASKDLLTFVETLVRVDGLSDNTPDPLTVIRSKLDLKIDGLDAKALFAHYRDIAGYDEPMSLVANLVNCVLERPYEVSPFGRLRTGSFPKITFPSPSQVGREAERMVKQAGLFGLAEMIARAYPDDVASACPPTELQPSAERVGRAYELCRGFLRSLLHSYSTARLSFRSQRRLYKMPGFKVLELLVDDLQGLYGFHVHFSNGTTASFVRHERSVECPNISLGPPVTFYAGDLDLLKQEWRVRDKRLYEVGLGGRYNKLGEWKPIIYPGNPDNLIRDAKSMSNEDAVQGTLFYMMATGYRVIEFVVSTGIELPIQAISFGDKFHLWLCPPLSGEHHLGPVRIYDGWLDLDSAETDFIRSALASIGVAVNRLAFAYGSSAVWRVKYNTVVPPASCAQPLKEDLKILDSLLRKFPQEDDAVLLDAAIDWYIRGASARNPFEAYLCYYIALESVAIAVTEGRADLGLGYVREQREERRRLALKCIQEKHDFLYAEDPERFVRESYFHCVVGLAEKTRRIVRLIFGNQHSYIEALFAKKDGYSLHDIRSQIAHGSVTLVDRDHEALVRGRLHEIARISREFLIRSIFLLKPTDPLPSWSRNFSASMSFTDPRVTLYATREDGFPTSDWRIRPEWCEPNP